MSDERLNDLKNILENPKNIEELYAAFCELYDNTDITEEEIGKVLRNMHLPEELKEQMKDNVASLEAIR